MGLRGNPFRVLPPTELPQLYTPPLQGEGPRADEIAGSRSRFIQILGDRGFGKSTLLAAVRGRLEEAGEPCEHRYFPPTHDGGFVEPAAGASVLLVDEAQRLGRKARRAARVWAEGGDRRLIATTHEDLRRAFGDGVETLRLEKVDARMIERVFRRRLEHAGADGESIRLTPRAARWLERAGGGCLRRVEELCYEVFQRVEPSPRLVIDDKLLERLSRGS